MEAAEMLVSLLDYKSLESLTSIAPFSTDIPTYHIMTLGNWNGLDGQYGQVVGVILLFSWSRSAQGDHGVWVVGIVTVVRVVFYSGSAGWSLFSIFWMVRWSGKLGWLGQFIWLIGWMVSVVKLVKWLGCWNQVVRVIYQKLDRMEIVSWGMNAILQKIKQNRYNLFTSRFSHPVMFMHWWLIVTV